MRTMNYRLQAFTLVETLMTLVIIGIISTMTYSLINVLGKQLQEYFNQKNMLMEYYLLDNALMKDLDNTVHGVSLQNEFKLITNTQEEITYVFTDTLTSRLKKGGTITYNCTAETLSLQKSKTDSLQYFVRLRLRVLNDTLTKAYTFFSDYAHVINSRTE